MPQRLHNAYLIKDVALGHRHTRADQEWAKDHAQHTMALVVLTDNFEARLQLLRAWQKHDRQASHSHVICGCVQSSSQRGPRSSTRSAATMVRVSMISLLNCCKVTTLAALAACAYYFGFQTMRAYVYFATHVSYLIWWFLHQRISPSWGRSVFGEGDVPVAGVLILYLIVGPGYAIPGYFAFKSTAEPNPWALVASIMLYTLGSLINAAGDWYKDGAKSIQRDAVVMTGPFRLSRHISWFGDWMRYGSYALMSGSPMGLFPLAWTMFFNLGAVQQRSSGQATRGGEAYKKWAANTPAVIPWRLLL